MRGKLEIGNSRSQITELRPEIFDLLRYELSYLAGEPGERRHLQKDGSVKVSYWDGFRRLMTTKGVFPSGLVPRALRLLRKWKVGVEMIDRRQRPEDSVPLWKMPDDFSLRDYQEEAVQEAQKIGRGVIDSPPRTGKTIMMADLVRRVSDRTVITAPTEAIARQTMDRLLELFAENEWTGQGNCSDDFFLLTGGPPKSVKQQRKAKKARVFIATAATAAAMPEAWWERIRCLIVDERHHQAAKTYHQINDLAVNAYYRWGFTGTNYRSKPGEQVALEACLGRIVASYGIQEMTQRGVLVPGEVEFWTVDFPGVSRLKFKNAYPKGIVQAEPRNELVAQAAGQLQRDGRKVLILVHQIKHGTRLAELIRGSVFVQAADGSEVRAAVAKLDRGDITCLIGSPVVGEGLDCPAADALIYPKGYMARVTHTQDTFRVLTGGEGKRPAKIIDFVDRQNKTLLDHSVERMRNYVSMGLKVSVRNVGVDMRQLSITM